MTVLDSYRIYFLNFPFKKPFHEAINFTWLFEKKKKGTDKINPSKRGSPINLDASRAICKTYGDRSAAG